MNVYKIYLCFLLIGLVSACKMTEDDILTVELKGVVIDSKNIPLMRFPYRIELSDDKLVLLDLVSSDYCYHLLKYPDLSYLHSFGMKGNGPNEIILPTPFQLYDGDCYFLDGANSNLYSYSLEEPFVCMDHRSLGEGRTLDFVVLNDTCVLVEDFLGKNRIKIKSPTKEQGLFVIPHTNVDINNDAELAYLWRSFMAYNDTLQKVVLATQFGDALEIYKLKDKSSKIVLGKGGAPITGSKQIEGFHDVKWINDNIYALFSGRIREQMILDKQNGKKVPTGGNVIKVYNADGILLKQYKLDTYINGFTYDKANNRMIGICSNQDSPIVYFEL